MKIRRKLFPKCLGDAAGVSFILMMIPVCYWFEVFIALPIYYEKESLLYNIHCVISTILLFNLVSNYVAVYLADTSIEGRILPSTLNPTWMFCSSCECVSPPRSWHCSTCDICILKRDHHCVFTGCCIGHLNHRYFIMFLFYLSLCTLYCTYYNIYYLWRFTTLSSWYGFVKLILPLAVFMFGSDTSVIQVYRLISVITIIAMIAAVALFIYHVGNIINGVTVRERNVKCFDYHLGNYTENLKQVLGERYYLTWISPFIKSELPHDGIFWDKLKSMSSKAK